MATLIHLATSTLLRGEYLFEFKGGVANRERKSCRWIDDGNHASSRRGDILDHKHRTEGSTNVAITLLGDEPDTRPLERCQRCNGIMCSSQTRSPSTTEETTNKTINLTDGRWRFKVVAHLSELIVVASDGFTIE